MIAVRTSKEQLKKNYGNDADINLILDRGYLGRECSPYDRI